MLKKRLPPKLRKYRIVIEARLNDLSSARAEVEVRIQRTASTLLFKNVNFIVIPSDYAITTRNGKLIKMEPIASDESRLSSVTFRLKTKSRVFEIHSTKGTLSIKRDLSRTVTRSSMLFNVTVIVTARAGKRNIRATNTVHIVVVPRNSGNSFVESSIKAVNLSEARKQTETSRDRGPSVEGYREFSLHRLFRRPSAQVQKISASDLRFNWIINDIKRKVVNKELGRYS